MPHKAGVGVITGIVSEDGVPCSKRVALVDRSTLSIVARTQSDTNGKYTFSGLNTDTNDYLVFGVDDNDPLKNAEIHDYIRPISGHNGATYPNNWLWLVLRKNPTNLFTGHTQNNDFNGFSINAIEKSGVVMPNQASQTPYAPNLPMTELNVGKIITTGFTPDMQSVANDTFTIECILDLSSDSVFVHSTNTSVTYDNFNNYISYYFYTSICLSHGVLSVAYKDNSRNYYETIRYNTPHNGVAHVVAVFEMGNQCRLFVNGEKVGEAVITHAKITTAIAYTKRLTHLVINGIPANLANPPYYSQENASCVGKIGAVACYYDLLSNEEVLEHYQALFTETLPRLTGYIKECFVDNPCHIYRLNEPDIAVTGAVDLLTQNKKLAVNNAQAVTPNQPSVITGGNTVLLNGTHFTGTNPYFTTSIDGFTFECVLRCDTDATNEQTLYSQSTDNIVIKRLKTSGNIQVSYPLTGTTETVQFNPLPQGELLHLGLVIDKINNKAILYINGEVVEEKNITVAKMLLNAVGNDAVKTLTIGQNFIGLIGDIALYPKPLSAERMKAHNDAREIV